jgi:TolB-like protein
MPDIFLSYNRDDAVTARRFAEGFERQGFTVWWDATLRSGEAYDEVTERALADAKAVVVLWSAQSVNSRWVRAEANEAARNKSLVPVMIEPCKRPIMFELTQTADLSNWNGDVTDAGWQAFVTDVRRHIAADVPGSEAPALPSRAVAPRDERHVLRWVVVSALVLFASGSVWLVTRHSDDPVPANGTAGTAQAAGASIAVLPFADISPQHDQDYFSDGLSEELLNQLALISGLQVAGRTSSFSFKGKGEDLKTIGRKLGVNHLLDGSVRKDGQQLRITAELINTDSGIREWSRSYDRKLENVFAVQAEIATDVAAALSIRLGVGSALGMVGGTSNVAAYEKYLRARALATRGGPDQQRGIELFREALMLDPAFARAWSELYGELRRSRLFISDSKQLESVREEMAQASARAQTLAPDAWWTHSIRAQQLRDQHLWIEAEAEAKQAVAVATTTEVDAIRTYAEFLNEVGRVGESIPFFLRMRDADPLSRRVSVDLQVALRSNGQLSAADREYERSKDLAGFPDEADWYAMLRLWSRKDADSTEVARRFHERRSREEARGPTVLSGLEDKLGDPADALDVLREAMKGYRAKSDWGGPTSLALMADHFGDRDLALDALRRRLEMTEFHFIAWWPYETQLRSNPRFKQIVRDLKLDEYWRRSGKWGDYCKPVGEGDFECH